MIFFLLAILIVVGVCVVVRLGYHPFFFSRGSRLPPGSMGWPFIGETLQLYSQNPNVFFSTKQKRYGEIFKTRILGCPCIMVANPEAVRFVLVQKAQIFKPTFPASKERMLGRNALFFQEGEYHTRLRKLVHSSFLPEAIRGIVPDIDKIAQNILKTWEGRTLNTFQEMKKYAFDVGLHSIFGPLEVAHNEALKKYYHILEEGYNSLPLKLPGTLFNKSIKAREKLGQILSKIIAERRDRNERHEGFLQSLMASRDEKGQKLKEEQIADNVIGVLFAAHDTTASVLTWLIKYLAEYPVLLDAVIVEQDAIGRNKEEEYLTIADTKKMLLTTRVIQETLRVATVLSFTFREAAEDVEYKGFLIPKGWKVLPLFRNIHHNPEFFPDPQHFDPSRFLVAPRPNTFMPFGNGIHSCPGNQLAYTEMFILIHHLTTKYRWQIVGTESGIEYGPFPLPKQGLPVRLIPR